MVNRSGRKRLSVDLPIYIYNSIKNKAKARGITITMWVIRACHKRLDLEKELRDKDGL